MSKKTENTHLQALATDLTKNLKTEKDRSALSREIIKLTVETTLGKDREEHLGYVKHSPDGRGTSNSRNDTSKKPLKGQIGGVRNIHSP